MKNQMVGIPRISTRKAQPLVLSTFYVLGPGQAKQVPCGSREGLRTQPARWTARGSHVLLEVWPQTQILQAEEGQPGGGGVGRGAEGAGPWALLSVASRGD